MIGNEEQGKCCCCFLGINEKIDAFAYRIFTVSVIRLMRDVSSDG